MNLKNRTVLITGGTSGIGLELARRLQARGNTVIVTGRTPEKVANISLSFPGIHAIVSDVSNPAAITALHDSVMTNFPQLDVLINNAGVMRNIKLANGRSLEDVTREIDIDLSGPIRMVQQFLPSLMKAKEATIVNVSSGLAFIPFPAAPVYGAAKAGLHAYTKALRIQLRGTSVSVVELAPPGTDTSLYYGEFTEEVGDIKPMPLDKLADSAIAALEAGTAEIRPGLANVLKIMSRLAPGFMLNQMAKASAPKPKK